jgi:hypothetical protein
LVEETGGPGENHQPVTNHWQTLSHNVVGSWIYNYLCNQCLSLIKLWVRILFIVRCTLYNIMWWSLSVTCGRSMVYYGYSGFLHQ